MIDLFGESELAEKKHDPRIHYLKGYWNGCWIKKYGTPYMFRHAADGAIFKRLLTLADEMAATTNQTALGLVSTAIDRFFNGHLKWFKGRESIGSFSKHINHLIGEQGGSHHDSRIKPTGEDAGKYRSLARRGG